MPLMSATIHEVLDNLRASALDERDKGDKFERLMQGYFRTDPQWALQFSDVWLWSEWPGRAGRPDTGIDLVARERDTEALTAIQCKFHAPGTYVSKSHIDSFFTASGRTGFKRRIVVSTSDNWSKNAEDAGRPADHYPAPGCVVPDRFDGRLGCVLLAHAVGAAHSWTEDAAAASGRSPGGGREGL